MRSENGVGGVGTRPRTFRITYFTLSSSLLLLLPFPSLPLPFQSGSSCLPPNIFLFLFSLLLNSSPPQSFYSCCSSYTFIYSLLSLLPLLLLDLPFFPLVLPCISLPLFSLSHPQSATSSAHQPTRDRWGNTVVQDACYAASPR